MQLVEDEELQPLRGLDQLAPLLRPGEHQLEHDVVGEQDVGRVGENAIASFAALLSGVPGERDRLAADSVTVDEELLEFP